MKKNNLFFAVCLFYLLAGFVACGNNIHMDEGDKGGSALTMIPDIKLSEDENRTASGPEVSDQTPILAPLLTPTNFPEPLPTMITAPTPVPTTEMVLTPSPEPTSILEKGVSYQVISPRKDITVYISEKRYKPEFSGQLAGDAEPQVVVRAGNHYYRFDVKDYCLDNCEPIVMMKPGRYAGLWCDEVLSIVLPAENTSDTISVTGVREVYGCEYVLDIQNLKDGKEVQEQEVIPGSGVKLAAGFQADEKGRRMFTLTVSDWFDEGGETWGEGVFWYPELKLPEQESYSLICEEAAHFTESGVGYRRVRAVVADEVIELGKFCNNIFFPDAEKGYYGERKPVEMTVSGPYLYEWQARPLEPEFLIDLDGDGTNERVSYRLNEKYAGAGNFIVMIDGEENILPGSHNFFKNYMFTASLDGETRQLMVLDYEDGRSRTWKIYSYLDGKLCAAGEFPYADYHAEEKDGRWIYSALKRVYPLQNDKVLMHYRLMDGILQLIPGEYYEFVEYWPDEDGEPERNIITAREDFELFTQKNTTEKFTIPAGSRMVTLGGDLGDWILMENVDTNERGWLMVKGEKEGLSYNAMTCIRSDGTEINCKDLFDGLLGYD